MPIISVIVPVYNAEKMLHECVNSILAQTFTDFELILVNDGSPDKSGGICDDYVKKDSRVRVIHQKNQGQAAARNRAIKESRAQWLHFVDSDDVIHPQMLECLYHAVITQGTRIAMCDMVEGREVYQEFFAEIAGQPDKIDCDEELLLQYLTQCNSRYGVVWAMLVDKTIVQKHLFTEGKIYEDSAVFCDWLCEAGKLSDINLPLYFYRVNLEGTTKSRFAIKHLDRLWSYQEQIKCYRKYNYKKLLQVLCNEYMWLSHEYYLKTINEFKRPDLARMIARKTYYMYCQNRNVITLTDKQIAYILETMYPKTMALYWRSKAVQNIIKEKGVAGVIKKVINRVK